MLNLLIILKTFGIGNKINGKNKENYTDKPSARIEFNRLFKPFFPPMLKNNKSPDSSG